MNWEEMYFMMGDFAMSYRQRDNPDIYRKGDNSRRNGEKSV